MHTLPNSALHQLAPEVALIGSLGRLWPLLSSGFCETIQARTVDSAGRKHLTDGLYELGYQWPSMTARRMFRAIVHAAGVALIAWGLSILFPILESPADPIDLFFRLGSGVPSALLGLYLLCAAAHAVRFGYPLVRRGERRRLARSSLGPRGAFGLVVRVVGLGLVLGKGFGVCGDWHFPDSQASSLLSTSLRAGTS